MSITFNSRFVKCRNCGETCYTDELVVFTERHGFSEGPYEQFLVCPFCRSTSLDDVEDDEDENT